MRRDDRCWICGRPRGLAQRRESWGLNCSTVFVPRTDNPEDRPAQIANDLIVNASIYRNGGSNETTHICDACLRVGLRSIKVSLSMALAEFDTDHDKDAELAELTARLAHLQCEHHRACFEHDRMQDRLAHVLSRLDASGGDDDEVTRSARWEVGRQLDRVR